jgi:glycosyltransferase involved in cell wall biosynthesis
MLLSVIIPTYKRREALGVCLKLLAPEVQKLSPDVFEIVVTDDALADNPTDSLSQDFPGVIHNSGPQKGPAANRNSGAKAAHGEWLLFLDDDCLPQPAFLSSYIEAMQKNPDYQIFEGRTLTDRPQLRMDEEAPLNDNGGYLWSCNFLIQRKLFFELGGFCELYPYACMEDVDFREQLKLHDLKFLFVPGATVVHPWRPIAPDGKFLKMRLISHAIFLDRYPQLQPSFFKVLRTNIREWLRLFFVDGPRMKYRGFWRYLARHFAATLLQFLNWLGVYRKKVSS